MSAFFDGPSVPPRTNVVMIVDDDEASRDVVRFLLEEEGYHVVSLGSPAAVLAFLTESRDEIAVLLTDVHMPGMSGPELATRVRAMRPGLHVAFLTGDLAPPSDVAGTFIQKPVDLGAILAFVARSIGPAV